MVTSYDRPNEEVTTHQSHHQEYGHPFEIRIDEDRQDTCWCVILKSQMKKRKLVSIFSANAFWIPGMIERSIKLKVTYDFRNLNTKTIVLAISRLESSPVT
jgi:hypothetical protein